jgi:hypothetical protein
LWNHLHLITLFMTFKIRSWLFLSPHPFWWKIKQNVNWETFQSHHLTQSFLSLANEKQSFLLFSAFCYHSLARANLVSKLQFHTIWLPLTIHLQLWVQEFFLLGVERVSYHKKIPNFFIFLKIGLIKMCYKKLPKL